MKLPLALLALIGCLVLAPTSVQAHKPSDSYLNLRVCGRAISGEWHLNLRDLEDAIGLDSNDDGVITWHELLEKREALSAYASSRLHLSSGTELGAIQIKELLVDNHSDGAYAVLRFDAEWPVAPATLTVEYRALFDIDPSHRGLLHLERNDSTTLAIFGPERPLQTFALDSMAARHVFLTFIKEGVWHIWTGYDHMLFLLALLLPGVLFRSPQGWAPLPTPRPAFVNVLRVVTAFTVAHSITLSLAALGWVHPPERLIESAIAASVALAAFNNLVPFFAERGWMVAFGFGLIHGFGFANALSDLGLAHGQLAKTLFGFNLGVEGGQLLVVALFLPVALALRRLTFYRRYVLGAGSVAIVCIATAWFAQRLLG